MQRCGPTVLQSGQKVAKINDWYYEERRNEILPAEFLSTDKVAKFSCVWVKTMANFNLVFDQKKPKIMKACRGVFQFSDNICLFYYLVQKEQTAVQTLYLDLPLE